MSSTDRAIGTLHVEARIGDLWQESRAKASDLNGCWAAVGVAVKSLTSSRPSNLRRPISPAARPLFRSVELANQARGRLFWRLHVPVHALPRGHRQ